MNNSVTIAYRFEITLQLCLFDGSKPKNNDEHQPRLSNFFKNFDSNGGDDLCYQGGLDQRKLDMPYPMEVDTPYRVIDQNSGLESVSIRRIQCIEYGVLGFLGVGTTLHIFQNIHLLYLQYDVLVFSGYGVLIMAPSWSLVSAGTDTPYLP
ncbi:hypothetical protein Tco_1554483 [Tanacetum coccineum]